MNRCAGLAHLHEHLLPAPRSLMADSVLGPDRRFVAARELVTG